MKKGVFEKLKGVLAILLIVSCFGLVYGWETFGRERFLYQEVLVFKDNVPRDTKITEENIDKIVGYMKFEQNKIISEPIKDKADIIGLATKSFIPKNAQLTLRYFDNAEVVLSEDEFIFKVPKEWILATPSSLRRKDKVFFYSVKDIDDNSFKYMNQSDNIEEDMSMNSQSYKITSAKEPMFSTHVAYVKDNANREIITVSERERYDGSAELKEIEIIVNLKQMEMLEKNYEKGNKLIIMYQDFKMGEDK